MATEDDTNEPALNGDATLQLIEGAKRVTPETGIFQESMVKRLSVAQRQTIVASSGGRALQLVLFVLCALCGSMLPLVQQWTKSYPATYIANGVEQSCEGREGHTAECKAGMLYLPGTAVAGEKITSLVAGLTLTVVLSGKEGLQQCVNPARLKMTAPIAFFYVLGDVVQLMAIDATNASFFIVIGQMKLLATAVVAFLLLSTRQSLVQWLTLGAVTVTCGIYCDLELYFIKGKGRGDMESYGLMLSLLKVILAAVNAVLTERAFKASGSEPIWVNQVQLKICSVPMSLVLIAIQYGAFCSHERKDCLFTDRGFFHGWTYKNLILLVVQVFNNFVLGLVYKKVNAVVKYLAYAQSLWITYLLDIVMLGVAFNIDLFLLIILLVLLVIIYSFGKVSPAPRPKEPEGNARKISVEIAHPLFLSAGSSLMPALKL